MFYESEDSGIENYVDDTTPYACVSGINSYLFLPNSMTST